jgi:hypothetical protein
MPSSFRHVFLILLLGSVLPAGIAAQSRDSVRYGALPALGYTSDDGFVAGGIASRYVYRDGYRPFRQYQFLSLVATSNGMYAGEVMSEHNARSRRGIRSQISAYVSRVDAVQWFGEGHDTPFDADTYRAGGYDYAAFNALAFYRGRIPIYRTGYPGAQLDGVFGMRLLHNKPFGRDTSKTFWKDAPRGSEGVTTAMLTAGLQWENRDHELDPTRGNTAVLEAAYSQRGGLLLTAWITQYVPIDVGHRFVLAGRLGFLHASGDIPYDLMPAIGGDKTVRGYVVNRFRGDGAAWYNAEIRTWVYALDDDTFRFGLQAFSDGGRVVTGHAYGDLPADLRTAHGAGFVVSLFTRDFMLRGDYGISDEIGRMYLGIGYAF